MDTIEKSYIYKETKDGNQINDKNTIKQNRIYDAITQGENDRSRSHGSPAFKQSNKLVRDRQSVHTENQASKV